MGKSVALLLVLNLLITYCIIVIKPALASEDSWARRHQCMKQDVVWGALGFWGVGEGLGYGLYT